MQQDKVIVEGVIKECLKGTQFLVEININGVKKDLIGYISGKMRKAYIKVTFGDRVKLELSKYDLTKGRIVTRL
jgi:translation initiation factor IF-1